MFFFEEKKAFMFWGAHCLEKGMMGSEGGVYIVIVA
jgi:hypothetical protein